MYVVEEVFIAEEIGHNKPHKEFFEGCMKQIEEQDVSKILIIGDSLSSDIKGGNRMGYQTCWYNPHNKVPPNEINFDYEIYDLHQIYEILNIFN